MAGITIVILLRNAAHLPSAVLEARALRRQEKVPGFALFSVILPEHAVNSVVTTVYTNMRSVGLVPSKLGWWVNGVAI